MRPSKGKRRSTYQDLLALPEHVVGEIVDGDLHVSPRPAGLHALATSRLNKQLGRLETGDGDGRGGWWIIFEPELHLGTDVLVPDLAAWRRERMPNYPDVPFFALAPDWVCEVLSPSTSRLDLALKLPNYARAAVAHAWTVHPMLRTLQVFRRQDEQWVLAAAFGGDDKVRAEPFTDIEFGLDALWPPQARERAPTYPAPKRRTHGKRKPTDTARTRPRERGRPR